MAFVVRVEGTEAFEIFKECVKSVKMTTNIPQDSNARIKDFGAIMTIKGKILTAVGGDPFDSTRKIALWSVVPAAKADSYRKVIVEYVAAGIMERKYCFPNAFVIDYKEDYGDGEGTGTFTLRKRSPSWTIIKYWKCQKRQIKSRSNRHTEGKPRNIIRT